MASPAVTIDAFTTVQSVIAPFPVGTQANSSLAAPEAIGGERDLIGLLAAGGQTDNLKLQAGSGRLEFDPTFGASGTYTVAWDGPDHRGDSLDPIGLRTNGQGQDLTKGGTATAVYLSIGVDKPNTAAMLRVYTDADNWSQVTATLADTGGQANREYLIDMAGGFSVGAGTGANFANVGAIVLEVNATVPAMDGQMTVITTQGPGLTTVNLDNVTTADLSLTLTANNVSPGAGTNVNYTVTLTNAGPAAASNVAVSYPLPAGLTYVSATASTGSYNQSNGTWTVGGLAKASSATLQVTATVKGTSTAHQHRPGGHRRPAGSRFRPQQQRGHRGRSGLRHGVAASRRPVAASTPSTTPARISASR